MSPIKSIFFSIFLSLALTIPADEAIIYMSGRPVTFTLKYISSETKSISSERFESGVINSANSFNL